ncbi:MAG: winged helix-turn-helix transcriptional regulator [Proteobacteria bacterium]|nr:winged helix-turn-helix transcriptional regulator [Pseudomonadota bacterium]
MRADPLSSTFAALADPTRRAILARLIRGEASVGELAKPFDLSLPTVSRHLTVLEQARLIERQRDAQWRRCRLTPEPLMEAAEWIARYRAYWEGRLDALTRFLVEEGGRAATARRAKRRRRKGTPDGAR